MVKDFSSLRKEVSINNSGKIFKESKISILRECDYFIFNTPLDGDAPKQFIKAYFYTRDSEVRRKQPNTWIRYIAKTAEKWYPHESIVEFMINRIGQELGVLMNEVKLIKANGQIRFLSQYFLKGDEKLVHGAEICGEHLGDVEMAAQIAKDKPTARELFTFEFIEEAIRAVYPQHCERLLLGLIKMITFDCLAGNNDRHFYNWGVIDNIKKGMECPRFAPLYDSARGLLWNYDDENIIKSADQMFKGGKKIDNYIDTAEPRISIIAHKEINHFDLIAFLKKDKKNEMLINEMASIQNEERVIKMLKREFFPFFIKKRTYLVEYILRKRFEKTRRL